MNFFFLPADISLSLTGSPYKFKLGARFTFTCTIHYAVNLADIIDFHRNDSHTNDSVAGSIQQQLSNCRHPNSTASNNYRVACGDNTGDMWSKVKVYRLYVLILTLSDLGSWWCELKRSQLSSNVVELKTKSERVLVKRSV